MKTPFRLIFDKINEDLKNRYNLPPSFFEDREKMIPRALRNRPNTWIKNYLRRIMRYINAYRMKSMHDQYTILRLDDELKRSLNRMSDDREDSISQLIRVSVDRIHNNTRYLQFYRSLGQVVEKNEVEYPNSFEELKNLIEKYPQADWNLSCADWFGCMNDDESIHLINEMNALIDLIDSLG